MKAKTVVPVVALIIPVLIFGLTNCTRQSDSNAQNVTSTAGQPNSVQQSPPPATKLEGFKPAAGSVVTLGYDELGSVKSISVDVREFRDAKGTSVLGIIVEVVESEYRKERSFVDADEIPDLLKGIDALLEVKTNPTKFKHFEVQYTTRGELQLTVFNMFSGEIGFAVRAGRALNASQYGLSATDMMKFRTLIAQASQKISAVTSGK